MQPFWDMDEREVYVPREPGPEVERYWPVSTRATALEFARLARLRSRGVVAVDDATLERVADAIMDPANPPPWVALTAEERQDQLPEGLWDALQGYLIDHPEVEGTVDLVHRDGRATFVVGITGDPQAHQAALAAIGGDRVVVEPWAGPAPYTDAELLEIAARVSEDGPELAAAGWHVTDTMRYEGAGVEVAVVGVPDERAAGKFFADRYGPAVSVQWLGPNRFLERLQRFGSWASDGRRLRVYYALDVNDEEPGRIRVAEENEERIVVALSSLEAVAVRKTLILGWWPQYADVELRQPVGNRVVIDASTGVARPSIARIPPR